MALAAAPALPGRAVLCWVLGGSEGPSFLTHLELERMPCCFLLTREAENSHGGLSAQEELHTTPAGWERQFPQRILVGGLSLWRIHS